MNRKAQFWKKIEKIGVFGKQTEPLETEYYAEGRVRKNKKPKKERVQI